MDMERQTHKDTGFSRTTRRHIAGNAVAMVFMAIGMAGVVTYGLNNIMRGPAVTAAETSRRTIAENNLVASTRIAITAAARQQNNGGDCDMDGFVEPVPFRAAGTLPAPAGGGLLPMTLGASMTDPWNTEYGYCVWDPGTVSQSDNNAGCNNATGSANRLQGAPRDDQPAIAIISAGKNGEFETICSPYADTAPADNKPDVDLVVKPAGSDDIVLTYTYAEANGIGGGLWKLREGNPNIAEIDKGIKSTSHGGATFGGKVELTNKGLVLPGDPGDNSVTGACDAAKDGQLRRNINPIYSPAAIEMCDHTNGNGWVRISGSATTGASGFNPETGNCTINEGGPFFTVDSMDFSAGQADRIHSIWTKSGSGSQTIYAAAGIDGILALSFNGSSLALLDQQKDGIANWSGIWGDGTHVYASSRLTAEQVTAFTFDGTNFTQTGTLSRTGNAAKTLSGLGNVVFMPNESGGTHAYSFDGTGFTLMDTYAPTEDTVDTWTNGTSVYSVGPSLHAAQWNGSTFTNSVVGAASINGNAVWADGSYIYVTSQTNGIMAFTFDGVSFTEVTKQHTGLEHFDLWSDGVYLYAATRNGVRTYLFDGVDFTVIDENTSMGHSVSVWGDGNYIYVGTEHGPGHTGSIHVLGGFACLSPDQSGGTASPLSTTVGKQKILPDPLDTGLIAHWKMNDALGETEMRDSIGNHHGTLVNNVAQMTGQDGGLALSMTGTTVESHVMVPGLLGELQQGTIAGWVNSGRLYPQTDHDRSVIFSIGNYVSLVEYHAKNFNAALGTANNGLVLSIKDNASWRNINTNYQLMGTGWHYVVATFDTVNNAFRVYVDGQMLGQSDQPYAISYSGGGTDTYFGRHPTVATTWGWNGSIDDFRVYSRALSGVEATALSQRSLARAPRAAPAVISPLHVAGKAGKLSAGAQHSCAIKNDGTLWCWGTNSMGQVGDGSNADKNMPVRVQEPTEQVFYLNNTNSDLSEGGNRSKKLLPYLQPDLVSTGGLNPLQSRTIYGFTDAGMPGVTGESGVRQYSVVLESSTAAACVTAGATVSRINASGIVQNSVNLSAVGTSSALSAAVTLTGSGNLGNFSGTDRLRVQYTLTNICGSPVNDFSIATRLNVPLLAHTPWVSVSAGENVTCGLKADGSAWCWGMDTHGELGNSGFSSTNQLRPSRVVNTGMPWASLSTGGSYSNHMCAIQTNGTLWCWGANDTGQLGNGTTSSAMEPVQVGTDTDWSSVTTSKTHSCALKANGSAWCWGSHGWGNLGIGFGGVDNPSPVPVSDPGPWIKLSGAGSAWTCGLKTDSSLWCWGENATGQLGSSDGSLYYSVPTRIWGYPDGWTDISAGYLHMCGIRKDGNAWCWGFNDTLQLGLPHSWFTYVPQKVKGLSEVIAISGGFNHTCAIKANDAVYCWGRDMYGQLGNGVFSGAAASDPTPVLGFPGETTWSLDDLTGLISAPVGFNVGLSGSMIGDIGNNARGFGFISSGRARLYQDETGSVQLGLQAGTGGSSQISFKTTPETAYPDVTNGLAARWQFETNVTQSPGGGTTTAYGDPVYTDGKEFRYGIVFDSIDDTVTTDRSATHEPVNLTVSFWVRRSGDQGADAKILNKRVDTADPYISYAFSYIENQLRFAVGHTDNTMTYLDTPMANETWMYVTGTFNPSGTKNLKLYVNGKLVGTAEKTTALLYPAGASDRLFLGGCPTTCGGSRFRGAMDDLRIYNRALTEREVSQLYAAQISGVQPVMSMGIDNSNNQFKIAQNNPTPAPLDTRSPAINILSSGMTGIGAAVPTAQLDIQGGVRFGTEILCDANRAGAIRYTGGSPAWSYCNGTSWTKFTFSGPPDPTRWKKHSGGLVASGRFSCAIHSNGHVWCWGAGDTGQIGDGALNASVSPPDQKVQTNIGPNAWNDWLQISGNLGNHTCGIRTDRSAWCWGTGGLGRLGNNDTANKELPVRVQTSSGGTGWNDWVYITAGKAHSCGIRVDGSAWCWGKNDQGQLGGTTFTHRSLPVRVQTSSGGTGWNDWVSISTGNEHSCGIRVDGSAWCWGYGQNGRLGNNATAVQNRPRQVKTDADDTGWNDWVKVIAGWDHSCGIRADGSAWCWGRNFRGQLGIGITGADVMLPIKVHNNIDSAGWNDWIDISIGDEYTCGLRADRSAWCWGYGLNGRLGTGNESNRTRPTQVKTDADDTGWNDWTNIEAGSSHACGVRVDGSAWCWGNDTDGRLGDDTVIANKSLPVKVGEPTP